MYLRKLGKGMERNILGEDVMIGKTIITLMMLVDRWWWAVLMSAILWYCIWLFANAVDAHLTAQMNYWSRNLGM